MASGNKHYATAFVIATITVLAISLKVVQDKSRTAVGNNDQIESFTPGMQTENTTIPLFHKKKLEWKNKIDLFLSTDTKVDANILPEHAKKYFGNGGTGDSSVNYNDDIEEEIPEIHYKKIDVNLKKGMIPVYYPTPAEKRMLWSDVRMTYLKRKQLLRKECGLPKRFFHTIDMQLIAAFNKRVVVCVVQKAGSTSWHRLIWGLRNSSAQWVRSAHTTNFNNYKNLTENDKDMLLENKNVTRIIITRHPFTRLISGWENKFLNKYMKLNEGVMLKSMPKLKNFAKDYPDPYHYISFKGLVKFILREGMDNIDNHFKSIDQLCRPCDYAYDFVVKAETSPVKSWFVLDKFKTKFPPFTFHAPTMDDVKFTRPIATVRTDPNEFLYEIEKYESDKIRAIFSKLEKSDREKLVAFYKRDLEYFGYTFDLENLESTVL